MEVMANPIDEDQDEFIELLNYGLESIDLTGFRISDGDRESLGWVRRRDRLEPEPGRSSWTRSTAAPTQSHRRLS